MTFIKGGKKKIFDKKYDIKLPNTLKTNWCTILKAYCPMSVPQSLVFVVDKVIIARYSNIARALPCPEFVEGAFADFLLDLAEKKTRMMGLAISNDHVHTPSHKERLGKVYK